MQRLQAKIAVDWAIRCFGRDHVFDAKVRSLRLAEEAVELTQAYGVSRDMLHKLVDTVYDRPKSDDTLQELGGVALTLEVLCGIHMIDSDFVLEKELRRVLSKPTEHFTKRNEDKLQIGLTG